MTNLRPRTKEEPARAVPAIWRRCFRGGYRAICRQPARRLVLAAEAASLLALCRIALFFVPFQALAKALGKVTPAGSSATGKVHTPYSDAQFAAVQEIAWAVTRSARYVPFGALCLPQAMAAKAMLRRRGIASVLHFGVGVAVDGEPMKLHAWLDTAGMEVTGFPVTSDFVEVARFV